MSREGYDVSESSHRWFGMGALGFLLLSVSTGLLWADGISYWDRALQGKNSALSRATGGICDAVARSRLFASESGGGRPCDHRTDDVARGTRPAVLRGEAAGGGVPTTLLLDAMNGERLSPITQDLAPAIAAQYVRDPLPSSGLRWNAIRRERKRAYDAVGSGSMIRGNGNRA